MCHCMFRYDSRPINVSTLSHISSVSIRIQFSFSLFLSVSICHTLSQRYLVDRIILFSAKYHTKYFSCALCLLYHIFSTVLPTAERLPWICWSRLWCLYFFSSHSFSLSSIFYALFCINLHKCFYWCHYKMGSYRIVNRFYTYANSCFGLASN